MKPFWRTSEFWLSLAVVVGSALDQPGVPGWARALGAALASSGYAVSRGIAKGG